MTEIGVKDETFAHQDMKRFEIKLFLNLRKQAVYTTVRLPRDVCTERIRVPNLNENQLFIERLRRHLYESMSKEK